MKNMTISSVLYSEDSKLIYIYDFMNMWRFFVEYLETSEEKTEKCTHKVGEMPEEAPDLKFEVECQEDVESYEDKFEDSFDGNEYEY